MSLGAAGLDPKKALRDRCLRRRSMIDDDTRDSAAETVASRGLSWLDSGRPQAIGGYMAIRNELDITQMMETLDDLGHGIGLPVVVAKHQPMIFRAWDGNHDLPKTTFGVPTPTAEQVELEPDILLVPLLAFDADGYRLGYGGGFYDRTIAKLRQTKQVIAIGVAFDEQEIPRLPREPHDIPMDWILTQSGPRKIGG
jgi:5-formyltetrahydrofolate cyclo-ligase